MMQQIQRAWAEPATRVAGQEGPLVVGLEIGPDSVPAGSEVCIQLPKAWHAAENNQRYELQTSEPASPGFVCAFTDSGHASLECQIDEGVTPAYGKSLTGEVSRYAQVIGCKVDSDLDDGALIQILYGPGPGSTLPGGIYAEGPQPILISTRLPDATDRTLLPFEMCPKLEVIGGELSELVVLAPSIVRPGEPHSLNVVFLDRFGNISPGVTGTLRLGCEDTSADIPSTVRIDQSRDGTTILPISFFTTGIHRILVEFNGDHLATSNPILCTTDSQKHRLYWGDIHSHASHSVDAIGEYPYRYARETACLDFYARTEHVEYLTEETWQELIQEANDHNEDGRFVTLPSYEATFDRPWGHHNVYFRSTTCGALGADSVTLPELWGLLREGEALTIPHHTGIDWGTIDPNYFPPTVRRRTGYRPGSAPNPDWEYHDEQLRTLIEVYSAHGQCERFDPEDPLSYEQQDFTSGIASSRRGPYFAQDAWLRGLQLGVIGSSDDHRGQPGRGEFGLAAVWAPKLARDAVFDSLRARFTFATTGIRPILEMTANEAAAGQQMAPSKEVAGVVRVYATEQIRLVEVLAGSLDSKTVRVVDHYQPEGRDLEAAWSDTQPPSSGFYYMRLQEEGTYRGRARMAWTSPIWIVNTRPTA